MPLFCRQLLINGFCYVTIDLLVVFGTELLAKYSIASMPVPLVWHKDPTNPNRLVRFVLCVTLAARYILKNVDTH